MSLFRPRAAFLQRTQSTSQSDNSHSSESAASQPSNISSNTSCSTHFRETTLPASGLLPKGASPPTPPQLSSPVLREHLNIEVNNPNHDLLIHAQNGRGLLEPVQSVCYSNERQPREGMRRWGSIRGPVRGLPSRPLSNERIDLDDGNVPVTDMKNKRRPNCYLFLGPSRAPGPPPPSAYGNARRSPSTTGTRSRSPVRVPSHETVACEPGLYEISCDAMLDAQGNGQDRLTMANTIHLNKPLPKPPGTLRHRYESIAAQKAAYAEEEAESRFGHFSSSADSNSPGHRDEHAYTLRVSWPNVGHESDLHRGKGPSWSDSGHGSRHVTSPWDGSETCSQSFESHYGQPSASTSFTTLPALFSPSFRAVPTQPPSAHSVSLHAYRPPYLPQHSSPSKLSLRKRLQRALSLPLLRSKKEVVYDLQKISYPYSEDGLTSTLYGDSSAFRTSTSESQHFGNLSQTVRTPRKLKKNRPSSLYATPTPAFASGILRPNSTIDRTQPRSTSDLATWSSVEQTGAMSSPGRHRSARTPPLLPPPPPVSLVPVAFRTTPAPGAQAPLAPPRPRKLTRKTPSRQRLESASERLDATPPPASAVSPIDHNSKRISFLEASRSRSAPNLWPPPTTHSPIHNSNFHHGVERLRPSRFFLTDSPPSSPRSENLPGAVSLKAVSPAAELPSYLRSQSNRRWTLAASEVPDEQLVTELDRLRSVGWGLGFQGELIRFKNEGNVLGRGGESEQNTKWEKAEDEKWLVARQALLVCREIIRTEKSYREAMVRLQRGETDKAPPPLLLQYLPALISASQALNARLNDDPSTWGVSAAFIGMEDILEASLVAWSGIVGDFFSATKGKRRRRWSGGPSDKEKREKDKKAVTGAPVLPPVGSDVDSDEGGQYIHVAMKSAPSTWRMSIPTLSQLLATGNDTSHIESQRHHLPSTSQAYSGTTKTPTVQDLAIQPTQRVVRYVLLYKDLLNSTPVASPARALVERALESATRIAQRCNRAQDNAAFLT